MKILNKFENHRIQKNLSDVDPFFMLSIFAAWNEEYAQVYFHVFEIPHLQQWSGLERLWGRGHGLGLHAAHGGGDVLVTAAGVAAGYATRHPVFPSNAKLESVIHVWDKG